ncbi:MAG: hypothetical protein ABS47_08750 [Devosia sp. SCN 66-27]|nr:MAG: hypothetical protein ABS47_08750 [Devosia sp. SCN 66-27]
MPDRRLPLPVLMIAAVSLMNEVSAQMVTPLIPILLASVLAAGPVALGLVEGCADAVAAFLKLWSGRHADVRPERRKAMVLAGYALAVFSRPLLAVAGSWPGVVLLRSLDRLGKGLRGAPRDAILADATPSDKRGLAYGVNRAMDYFGAVLGTLIAAAVLAWSGLSIPQVIALSVIPGVLVVGLLAILPNPRPADAAEKPATPTPQALAWSGLSPSLRRYLRVLAIFVFAKTSESFIVLRGHELGMETVNLLLLWAWLAAVQSITALVGAPLADRLSKRTLTLFNWVALALAYGGLAVISSAPALWLAVSIYGLLSGISEGVERSLVAEYAAAAERGTAFGWYYLLSGLAAIPAGVLFGLIWKMGGPAMAFGVAAMIAAASALILAVSMQREGSNENSDC